MRIIRILNALAVVAAMLASQPILLSAQTKNQIEAAAQYDRALVFFQQGAYQEAEQAFRQAERKDDKNLEYQLAIAYTYLKLHKPDDALKRYLKIYKNDPTHLRAIVGMAASYEEMLNYREAVRMWQRYAKMDLPPAELAEADDMLRGAQESFVRDYEIAENPAGGAANTASQQQEREWGLQFARQLASTGVPLIEDEFINAYLRDLCGSVVSHAKGFPAEYELFVLNSPTINAQTTPGFVFVYRGILETAQSEAELAGVLAHEIGHTVAHHAAKSMARAERDQQTMASLQRSDNQLAKFLAGLMALGNPMGALSFSREQETQADRLGIHIAFDAGYDPRGLSSLFRKFEALQPSSRRSWDLITKTHPFSIDRMNMVNDYVQLLPTRSLTMASPEFERMKAILAKLPPPPETSEPAPVASGGGTDSLVRTFTLDNAPFAGEIPASWDARKTDSGTLVFEGQKGTEAYEATVELEVAPKSTVQGKTLEDVVQIVYQGTASKPGAQVARPEGRTAGTLRVFRIHATYPLRSNQGQVSYEHLSLVVDYPGYYAILSYFAPGALFEKYLPVFQQIGDSFRYTGR